MRIAPEVGGRFTTTLLQRRLRHAATIARCLRSNIGPPHRNGRAGRRAPAVRSSSARDKNYGPLANGNTSQFAQRPLRHFVGDFMPPWREEGALRDGLPRRTRGHDLSSVSGAPVACGLTPFGQRALYLRLLTLPGRKCDPSLSVSASISPSMNQMKGSSSHRHPLQLNLSHRCMPVAFEMKKGSNSH